MTRLILWLMIPAASVFAQQQDALSLAEAVATAQKQHPAVQGAQARTTAAGYRVEQARGGYLPRLDYMESYQRSNNPVFVFSTLLTQRRFTEQNFQIDALNNPGSVQNFQSVVSAEQMVFDGGVTRKRIQSAQLQQKLSAEDQRRIANDLAAGAVRAYLGALLAEESLKVASEAVRSAQADLERAEIVRNAGMSTDADVLSIRVHLAAVREHEIRAKAQREVAQAALNDVLGAPLDTPRNLSTALTPAPASSVLTPREQLEAKAQQERPDARQAGLALDLARTQSDLAKSAFLPQVSLRGALEADRGKFVTQAGGNWFAGVSLRWNLFNGFTDRNRQREAAESLAAAQSDRKQLESALKLGVRKAYADLTSATERIQVAEAAIAQAEESLRITRNRFGSGLNTVTDLLRTEVALQESRLRRLSAVHDQRVAAAMLEYAAGTLTADSEVLR
jgi:outer membrane protein TolC